MSTESLAEDLERAKQRVLNLIDEREQLEAKREGVSFWQQQHFDNMIHHAEAEVADLEEALADRGIEAPAVLPSITAATPVVVTQVTGVAPVDPELGEDQ